jgi:hypothetical protein
MSICGVVFLWAFVVCLLMSKTLIGFCLLLSVDIFMICVVRLAEHMWWQSQCALFWKLLLSLYVFLMIQYNFSIKQKLTIQNYFFLSLQTRPIFSIFKIFKLANSIQITHRIAEDCFYVCIFVVVVVVVVSVSMQNRERSSPWLISRNGVCRLR